MPGWAHLGSNQGPLACEASALPLSYAPGRGSTVALEPEKLVRPGRVTTRRSRVVAAQPAEHSFANRSELI